jgi:hypothetical protein
MLAGDVETMIKKERHRKFERDTLCKGEIRKKEKEME